MKDSTQDQVEGAAHQLKGTLKETLGRVLNNPNLQREGTVEKIAGKIQKKAGDVEEAIEP
jgi:uncharacterized protein YjbJ (UPF0337 family)